MSVSVLKKRRSQQGTFFLYLKKKVFLGKIDVENEIMLDDF
jgi:hypothetical protein